MVNELSPSLEGLATRIRKEQRAIKATYWSAVAHAMAAGDLLIEAKRKLKHGEWLPWLTIHCEIEERVAQNYMLMARNRSEIEAKYESDSDLTIRKALRLVAPTSGTRTVVEFPPDDASKSNQIAGGRPSDAFSIGALSVERQDVIEHGQAVLAEQAHKPGGIAWLRAQAAAARDAVASLRLAPAPPLPAADAEAEALEAFATAIIEAHQDAGEDPEMIRDSLFEVAELLLACDHPVRWAGYLRARGKQIAAAAAESSPDAQTMKLSGG